MKLYQDTGYVNIAGILSLGIPFNFVVGGRGTGKTYTSLDYVVENDIKFMFMRRTQAQADLINKPEFTPFKPLCRNKNLDIITKPLTKYNAGFYMEDENSPIGYTAALSTISNIRGFDASDVQLWIYDEFIPERHERPIKDEGAAFLNAYETINRNRELKGEKPLQVLCLANANDISNPIFMELGLVSKAEKMMRTGKEISVDYNRGVAIFMLNASPVSSLKSKTALYKLTSGSEFEKMSIYNDFVDVDYSNIVKRPLIEYVPVVEVGEICIYRHKNNNKLYVAQHTVGSPPKYSSGENDLNRYARKYSWIWLEYLANNIEFESVISEKLLTKYHK